MGKIIFSLLMSFIKSFGNGITLVFVLAMIPILFLGMTGIVDEAFAQNQKVPTDLTPVYVGTTDLSNLIKQSRGQSQVFDTPYLTKNPQLHDETKEQPLKMKTSKKMARIISQIPSQAPQPAAVNPITGFTGLSENGFIPPDVQIATGPNYVVELVNSAGRIWDTQGTFEMDFTLQDLFDTANVPFDPKILYDTQSGRWFASATTFQNFVHIAVSTTDDPTGLWTNYIINFGNLAFPDQPRIGVSDDKFVVSTNVFDAIGPFYFGVTLIIIDKSQMVAGEFSPTAQGVNLGTSRFSVKPVQSLSSTSTLYMVSLDDQTTDSTVTLWTITGSVPSIALPIPTLDLSIDPAANPPPAFQPGTDNIDTGDIRIQDARWFQGDLWFSLANACMPSGDTITRSCIHLVQIDTTSNPPSVAQDIQYGENGFYFFYPAISIDQFGGLGVVFGHSSSSTFPSLAITGQPAGSPLDTLDPRTDIKVGSAANPCSGSEPCNRYGDYFGAATDPSNPSIIWVAGQYHDSSSWSTWISTFSVSDDDVDGVENTVDNCPTIANGVNEDNQADTDNDGIGDACDLLPNDPNRQCVNQTGNWKSANLWTPLGSPISTERIVIVNCNLTIQSGKTVEVNNIVDVDSTSVINLDGWMTVNNQVNMGGTMHVNSNTLLVIGTYNVLSGGIHNNNVAGLTNVKSGGTFDVQSGGIVNEAGKHLTQTGGTTKVSGQWNQQGTKNNNLGTFSIESGGNYDNQASGVTRNVLGTFTVKNGGALTDSGTFVTEVGQTTTVSGTWNAQSGAWHAVLGTFSVASGGVYTNEAGGFTNILSGGTFDVQSGGIVNEAGKYFTQTGGTTKVFGQWNQQGTKHKIFGTFSIETSGNYNNQDGGTTRNVETSLEHLQYKMVGL